MPLKYVDVLNNIANNLLDELETGKIVLEDLDEEFNGTLKALFTDLPVRELTDLLRSMPRKWFYHLLERDDELVEQLKYAMFADMHEVVGDWIDRTLEEQQTAEPTG